MTIIIKDDYLDPFSAKLINQDYHRHRCRHHYHHHRHPSICSHHSFLQAGFIHTFKLVCSLLHIHHPLVP